MLSTDDGAANRIFSDKTDCKH